MTASVYDIQILLDGVVTPSARAPSAVARLDALLPPRRRPTTAPRAIKRALRRVATARQADWHLARDAGSAAFCARVNPSRSVDEIVDAMVVFGPPACGRRRPAILD